jgi:hypothetical protein
MSSVAWAFARPLGGIARRWAHSARALADSAEMPSNWVSPCRVVLAGHRGMPSSARQIRSTGPTVASFPPNYPPQHPRWSEAKYLGWSRLGRLAIKITWPSL